MPHTNPPPQVFKGCDTLDFRGFFVVVARWSQLVDEQDSYNSQSTLNSLPSQVIAHYCIVQILHHCWHTTRRQRPSHPHSWPEPTL
jgi:hypothetical protein